MPIIALSCTKCGGAIEYDDKKGQGTCPFCGMHYKLTNEVNNTIINQTTQIIRGAAISAETDEIERRIANLDTLISIKKYDIARQVLNSLLQECANDYRVWLGLIKYELCQFDEKYEDKSLLLSQSEIRIIQDNARRRANKMNKQFRLYENEIDSLVREHHQAVAHVGIMSEISSYIQDKNIENPEKDDYSVLDNTICVAINGLLTFSNNKQLGDFIICRENVEEQIVGYSFCYTGEATDVHLPNIFNDHQIKINRVYVSPKLKKYKIFLPEETVIIENGAFNTCEYADEIIIKSKHVSLKDKAFNGCKNLRCIRVSAQIRDIGKDAFIGCNNMHRIVISLFEIDKRTAAAINEIINNDVYYASKNVFVIQFEGVESIPADMFFANNRITHLISKNQENIIISRGQLYIIVSDGLLKIDKQAFCSCTKLKTINLTQDKLFIGSSCFMDSVNLDSCNIEVKNLVLEDFVFKGLGKKSNIMIATSKESMSGFTRKWRKGTDAKIKLIKIN